MKNSFMDGVGRASRILNVVAGSSLVFLMLLTVADVFLRMFDRPIPGTYELVSFMGVLVYGLALPFTSWTRQHIFVDFFIIKLPARVSDGFNVVTRVVGMALFFWFGWNVVKYAAGLQGHGELSPVLHMPFYPFAYALGVCCFMECVVLLCDMVKIVGGAYHE
jgi:TRAP-type C4-dicarboxylate transport system permease small subunit